jgi:hypothetical protein
MKRANLIVLGAGTCTIGLMLIASPTQPVNAAQPPWNGCVPVLKEEYNSAKMQKLLQTRFSTYVRTGQLGRRYYWYCHG